MEIFPSPVLNLIVGPNGTGKSSIVCAIALGVGGSPGCDSAEIEIDLHPDIRIKRIINIDDSEYYLNRRKTTEENIRNIVAKFNIQVNNLNMFLAQETEKAIGDIEDSNVNLFKLHNRLIELYNVTTQINKKLESLEEEYKANIGLLENYKRDALRFQMREEKLGRVRILEKYRPWVLFEEKRKLYDDLIIRRDSLKTEYETAKERHTPLVQRLEEKKVQYDSLRSELKKIEIEIDRVDLERSECSSSLSELENFIERKEIELKQEKDVRKDRAIEIVKLEKRSNELISQLREALSDDELNTQLEDVAKRINDIRLKFENIRYKKSPIDSRIRELNNEIRAISSRLERMEDQRTQRINEAKMKMPRFGDALSWLDANRSRFHNVIGPIALDCKVKTDLHARYLATALSIANRFMYIVETKSDFDLFTNELNKKRGINITCAHRASAPEPLKRNGSIEAYKQYGVKGWLDEIISCHEFVGEFLRSIGIANFAYSERDLPPESIEKILKKNLNDSDGLSTLYTPSTVYNVRFSRYGSHVKAIDSRPVAFAPAYMKPFDDSERKVMLDNRAYLQKELSEIQKQAILLENEEKEINIEENSISIEKRNLLSVKAEKKKLSSSIKSYNERLDSLRELQKSSRNEDSIMQNIFHYDKQRIKLIEDLHSIYKVWMTQKLNKDRFLYSIPSLLNEIIKLEREVNEQLSRFDSVLREYEQTQEATASAKRQARAAKEYAEEHSPFEENKEVFQEEWIPHSLVQLDVMKNELQVSADRIMYNEQAMQHFRDSENKVKLFEEQIGHRRNENERINKQIEEYRRRWLSHLEPRMNEVNRAFSDYFSRFNCSGAVRIKEDPNFDNYGIEICVSFRKDAELRPLSATLNSGGERSVSTMIYLLSLQQVTNTPFRVVDEINQGMDPINERNIFSLILESSHGDSLPQYFVVTPKLLPNLNYDKQINFFFVFHGPSMSSNASFERMISIDS